MIEIFECPEPFIPLVSGGSLQMAGDFRLLCIRQHCSKFPCEKLKMSGQTCPAPQSGQHNTTTSYDHLSGQRERERERENHCPDINTGQNCPDKMILGWVFAQ